MEFLYAIDFINVLKKKHAARSYREMVTDLLISKLLMLGTWINSMVFYICISDATRLYMWKLVKVGVSLKA